MAEHSLPDEADFVGPSGNATDKYGSRNPLTLALLTRFLREIDDSIRLAQPESLLDVGCGEGVVTQRLAAVTGARTVGVDLGSDELRAHWRRRANELVSFLPASAYDLPFEDDAFDCVCALEVLEHLERPREALRELARVSRRTLLLSVPREPIWRIAHLLAGRDVRRLGNTPGHVNHWSSGAFRKLVSEVGSVTRAQTPFPWTVALVDVRSQRTKLRGPPRPYRPRRRLPADRARADSPAWSPGTSPWAARAAPRIPAPKAGALTLGSRHLQATFRWDVLPFE